MYILSIQKEIAQDLQDDEIINELAANAVLTLVTSSIVIYVCPSNYSSVPIAFIMSSTTIELCALETDSEVCCEKQNID